MLRVLWPDRSKLRELRLQIFPSANSSRAKIPDALPAEKTLVERNPRVRSVYALVSEVSRKKSKAIVSRLSLLIVTHHPPRNLSAAHSPPYSPVTEILVNRLRYHAVTLTVAVEEPRLVARRRRSPLTDVAGVEAVPRVQPATLTACGTLDAIVSRCGIRNGERSVDEVVPTAAGRTVSGMLLR